MSCRNDHSNWRNTNPHALIVYACCFSCRIVTDRRFCIILIILSVIVVPFRIGFDAWPEGGWLVVDMVTDVTFAFDILFSFRTAYVNGHVVVTSPGLIASYYLRGWFTTDLLSTVPFDR